MLEQIEEPSGIRISISNCTLAIITYETDEHAVNRFMELCKKSEEELTLIAIEYEQRRQWNMDNIGKGRDWPIFKIKEKTITKLLREAGIIDS